MPSSVGRGTEKKAASEWYRTDLQDLEFVCESTFDVQLGDPVGHRVLPADVRVHADRLLPGSRQFQRLLPKLFWVREDPPLCLRGFGDGGDRGRVVRGSWSTLRVAEA